MKVILDCNIWISFLLSIRDPKDLYLLSLAEIIDADYIVSGDKDLTDLNQHFKTRIIKLVDFKLMMGF